MHKVHHICIFLLLAGLALGCAPSRLGATAQGWYDALPQDQKALMTVWKQDPCGCKGLRVSENAEQLLQLLLRGRLHEADVQVLLGPADETRRIQKSRYLVYRLDGKCGKQSKDEEGFLCFLRYEIGSKSHTVVGGDLICL